MKHEELITQPGTIVSHFKRNGYIKNCKEKGLTVFNLHTLTPILRERVFKILIMEY